MFLNINIWQVQRKLFEHEVNNVQVSSEGSLLSECNEINMCEQYPCILPYSNKIHNLATKR